MENGQAHDDFFTLASSFTGQRCTEPMGTGPEEAFRFHMSEMYPGDDRNEQPDPDEEKEEGEQLDAVRRAERYVKKCL